MPDLFLVIFLLTCAGVMFAAPVIAAVKGIGWWRELRATGRRPKIRIAEVVVFLLSLVPGIVLIILIPRDLGYGIPTGLGISAGMAVGALLGRLRAHAGASVPAGSAAAGAMLKGVVYSLPWCFAVFVIIPGQVASRTASHECAAIAALRTYVAAQTAFRRTDNYRNGKRTYANPVDGKGFPDLYEVGGPGSGGRALGLVKRSFAEATSAERPRFGYWFVDITGDANGPYDHSKQFGLCAVPAEYGRSGRNTFIIDARGKVYERNAEGNPLTMWPDLGEEGWVPAGGK